MPAKTRVDAYDLTVSLTREEWVVEGGIEHVDQALHREEHWEVMGTEVLDSVG